MGIWDNMWREWEVVGNSRGYSSPVFRGDSSPAACFVKVGDELRHARYDEGRWEDFAPVDGGRFISDPAVPHDDPSVVEVYGVGVDGQLARNWRIETSPSWKGWEDLGKPAGDILGNPAVTEGAGSCYVLVKGSDNRLYLRALHQFAPGWEDWEQGDKLGAGQFTGDPSIFSVSHSGRSELVVTGRSLEGEMASISRAIGRSTADMPLDALWNEWRVIGNSRGYSSDVLTEDANAAHCFIKVGDELRHARYHDGGWEDFVPVDGGRFRSDPVVLGGRNLVEVYGVGLEGQLARNVWRTSGSSWKGWEDLGAPAGGVRGTPAVAKLRSHRFVLAKDSGDRLHLCYSDNNGETWGPWEQGDELKKGIFRGEVSTFIEDFSRLVAVGRSLEGDMASITLPTT